VLSKAHPTLGQPIEVRGFDERLTVAPELAVAQIVGQYVDDVRRSQRLLRDFRSGLLTRQEQANRRESYDGEISRRSKST
jgi:hypothetical protein